MVNLILCRSRISCGVHNQINRYEIRHSDEPQLIVAL